MERRYEVKVKKWEEESDEEWDERLAEEIELADNAETTHYFVERDPHDEEGIIINYVGGTAITWKEHPEGPFKATKIIGRKNKAEKFDRLFPHLKYLAQHADEVIAILQSSKETTKRGNGS